MKQCVYLVFVLASFLVSPQSWGAAAPTEVLVLEQEQSSTPKKLAARLSLWRERAQKTWPVLAVVGVGIAYWATRYYTSAPQVGGLPVDLNKTSNPISSFPSATMESASFPSGTTVIEHTGPAVLPDNNPLNKPKEASKTSSRPQNVTELLGPELGTTKLENIDSVTGLEIKKFFHSAKDEDLAKVIKSYILFFKQFPESQQQKIGYIKLSAFRKDNSKLVQALAMSDSGGPLRKECRVLLNILENFGAFDPFNENTEMRRQKAFQILQTCHVDYGQGKTMRLKAFHPRSGEIKKSKQEIIIPKPTNLEVHPQSAYLPVLLKGLPSDDWRNNCGKVRPVKTRAKRSQSLPLLIKSGEDTLLGRFYAEI